MYTHLRQFSVLRRLMLEHSRHPGLPLHHGKLQNHKASHPIANILFISRLLDVVRLLGTVPSGLLEDSQTLYTFINGIHGRVERVLFLSWRSSFDGRLSFCNCHCQGRCSSSYREAAQSDAQKLERINIICYICYIKYLQAIQSNTNLRSKYY